jgi:transglutaminase-like putative cysteine protease
MSTLASTGRGFGAMLRRQSKSASAINAPVTYPDLRARRFMAFALALSQVANITNVKPLVVVAGMTALLLALALSLREPPRSAWWRMGLMALTIGAGVMVFMQHGRIVGRDPGVALLFIFGPLKLIEARSSRDFMVVWGLGLMLFVASFFENLGLVAALSVPPIIIVYIAALRLLDAPSMSSTRRGGLVELWTEVRSAATHVLLGVPLAAVMFVLFPRAAAPLWGMNDPSSSKSGLSEEMRPGKISDLILSKETAFRVEFEKRVPSAANLYWRGPVLREFDGGTWRGGMGNNGFSRGEFISFSPEEHEREAINYTVTVDKQESRWLPMLELPLAYPSGPGVERTLYLTDAQQIGVRGVPNGALQYRAQALARGTYSAPQPAQTSVDVQTGPREWNPRTRAFAADLASRFPEPRSRVVALLKTFNAEQFYYTLRPPLYGAEKDIAAIDEFLFDGRRGFCEHYAGATAFILRASGIPARVVTGYQGGEFHPSGYMIVRQSDAHAWVEAWLDGAWTRIDPTAAVAPSRIERGLEFSLPDAERLFINTRGWSGLQGIKNLWEEANFSYTKWVIGFDRDRQQALLKRMGLEGINPLAALGWMLLAITASGGLMALAWWLFNQRQARRADPWLRAWKTLRNRLQRAGLANDIHDTVSTVMARATEKWPAHASAFKGFADEYNRSRFAPTPEQSSNTSTTLAALPSYWQLRRQR